MAGLARFILKACQRTRKPTGPARQIPRHLRGSCTTIQGLWRQLLVEHINTLSTVLHHPSINWQALDPAFKERNEFVRKVLDKSLTPLPNVAGIPDMVAVTMIAGQCGVEDKAGLDQFVDESIKKALDPHARGVLEPSSPLPTCFQGPGTKTQEEWRRLLVESVGVLPTQLHDYVVPRLCPDLRSRVSDALGVADVPNVSEGEKGISGTQARDGNAVDFSYPPDGEMQYRGRHSRHAHRMVLFGTTTRT